MATKFRVPKKILNISFAGKKFTIKQDIMPDSARATKNVASHVKKGQPMKPLKKLNDGTGKVLGITVHNTGDIKVPAGTNPAEQYVRATYNGNMRGVIVHYYVFDDEIWQLLDDRERGWHAGDGARRKTGNRGTPIGGNMDTISIEVIGNRAKSRATAELLVAYLLKKHNLDPKYDVYAHKFWNGKNCPVYLLPVWSSVMKNITNHFNYKAPEVKPILGYKVGDKVDVKDARLYANSAGANPAGIRTGTFEVTIVAKGAAYPVHIDNLGWISEKAITRVVSTTPVPKPQPPVGGKLKVEDLPDKIEKVEVVTYKEVTKKPYIRLTKDTNLWSFNVDNWDAVVAVKPFKKGDELDVADIVTNSLGARYYRTGYSKDKNIYNGINVVDAELLYR